MPISVRAELLADGKPSRFSEWVRRDLEIAARAVTAGVTAATEGLKLDLRQAIGAAGFKSNRLEGAVGSAVWPRRRDSLRAAGTVYARGKRADLLLSAFAHGAVIRPTGRGKYLAIPTGFNQRGGRRGGEPIVKPAQMARMPKMTFVLPIKGSRGGLMWMLRITEGARRGANGRVVRQAFAGGLFRIRSDRRRRVDATLAAGAVPMFILLPEVALPKRFEADALHAKWAAAVVDLIEQAMPRDA